MKRIRSLVLILVATLILSACSNGGNQDDKKKEETVSQISPTEIIQSYVEMIYFDKGNYKEFQELYASKDLAPSESVFDGFRKVIEPKQTFLTDDIKTVMANMKVEEVDDTHATVYWVENKDDSIDKAKQKWNVVKSDDKWYMTE